MNGYHPNLAATGSLVIAGMAVGQQSLIGAALLLVGGAALAIRVTRQRRRSAAQ